MEAVTPKALRMLVCAGERHIVRLLEVNLKRQGYQVTCAIGGRHAIETVQREPFEFAVLAWDLSDPSAQAVKEWIEGHEETGRIKVLILEKLEGGSFRFLG